MDNSFLIRLGMDTAKMLEGINGTNAALNRFDANVKSVARSVAGAVGLYSIGSAISNSIKNIAEFQHSMQEVKAITGATGAEFEQLKGNALNLAGAFKAIDISRMEVELGRLGFSTSEIINTTAAAVNLAIATGSNLSKSADVLGSTLRAFNLDASQSGRVADVMASGFNKSALSLENFSEAIKYVAPVAAAAGISLERTTAILGVLADNGIRGSMAGTSFRKIISDIGGGAAPVFNAKLKEMADRGITASQAMDEVGRTAYASALIISKNTEKIDEMTEAHKKSNGELEKMAAIMSDDLIGAWNRFNAEIDRTLQKKGEGGVTGFFKDILDNLRNQSIVWQSDDVSIFEKIFGGAGDYARFATNIENARKKVAETEKAFNEMYVANPLFRSFGDQAKGFAPLASISPYKPGAVIKSQTGSGTTVDPYSHAASRVAAIAAGEGRSGYADNMLASIEPTKISAAVKAYAEMQAQTVSLSSNGLEPMAKNLTDIGKQIQGIEGQARSNMWKQMEDGTTRLDLAFEKIMKRLSMMGVQIGKSFSNAIAGVVQGTSTMAQALASVAGSIIDNLENIALAAIIASFAKDGVFADNPIGGAAALIGAVAGFGIIKGLFAQIGGSGGGGSGGSGSGAPISGRQQSVVAQLPPGGWRIDGRDVVYAYDLNKGYDNYTKG